MLALYWRNGSQSLQRLDPRTLKPLGKHGIALNSVGTAWGFSRDGSRLVLARDQTSGITYNSGSEAALRFIDLRRLRMLGSLGLPEFSSLSATAWLSAHRVLALGSDGDTTSLAVVDPLRLRVLRSYWFSGWPEAYGRTSDSLVFLLAAPNQIGPTRLVVARAAGSPRLLTLDRILSGYEFPTDSDGNPVAGILHRRLPGLALDPVADRAYVVGAGAQIARVDLRRVAVSYHDLSTPVSLLGRLDNWLEPAALAKGPIEGPWRSARWLGNGLIAVSGTNETSTGVNSGSVTPAGLTLIDTNTWTVRMLNPNTMRFSFADGLLLAYSDIGASPPPEAAPTPTGLTAYNLDGSQRFHLFASAPISLLDAVGNLAYTSPDSRGTDVIDLDRGQVIRETRGRVSTLLTSDLSIG